MRRPVSTALTIVAIALIAPVGAHAESCGGADTIPTSAASVAAAVDATLCLANQQRAAVGAPPLTLDPGLSALAGPYAQRMVAEGFFSHISPDGVGFGERLADIGDN